MFGFILTTGRLLEHWHGGSMTRQSSLNELFPQPLIDIARNRRDTVGLEDWRRGARLVAARIGGAAREGLAQDTPRRCFIPMHFVEAAANVLTIDALDPFAKIPEFKACAINIQVASEEELPQAEEMMVRGRK